MSRELLYNAETVFAESKDHLPSAFCRLTPFLRIMPDFFLVGVQKGGTTSLFEALYQHPQIIPNKTKEMFYYGNSNNFKKGKSFYKQFFATEVHKNSCEKRVEKPCHAIDASTDSFDSKEAPQRIFADNSNAKIVIILRDPVERAYSQYKFSVKLGYEQASFEKALDLEEERIASGEAAHNYAFQRLGYKSRGIYCNYIKNWQNIFDSKNIFIASSEEFFKEPRIMYNKLTDFLGLENNKNAELKKLNQGSSEKMNPETQKMLSDFYKPHNEKLFKILNKRYDW